MMKNKVRSKLIIHKSSMTGLNWACNGIGDYAVVKPEACELKVS